jgi:hypothetical protein
MYLTELQHTGKEENNTHEWRQRPNWLWICRKKSEPKEEQRDAKRGLWGGGQVFSRLILKPTQTRGVWGSELDLCYNRVHGQCSQRNTFWFHKNTQIHDQLKNKAGSEKPLSRKPSNRTNGSNSSPLSKWRLHVSPFVPASKSPRNTCTQFTLPLSLFLRVIC